MKEHGSNCVLFFYIIIIRRNYESDLDLPGKSFGRFWTIIQHVSKYKQIIDKEIHEISVKSMT